MIAYRNKNTAIHKLSPVPKLAWVAGIVVLSLLFDSPLYLALLFLVTLPIVAAAQVWREWASYLKLALFLGALVIVINSLINYHGAHVLVEAPFTVPGLGRPQVTLEAIISGIGNSLRLLATISAFSILTLTIHPDDLMQVLVKLKLPYKSVLVTSISTRFVPVLAADAARIVEVQQSRGLELGGGGLRQRIRNRTAVIIPLLANSLDRSVQVAEAMEARAFGSGRPRSNFKALEMLPLDVAALCMALAALGLGVLIRVLGQGAFRYFPAAGGPALDATAVYMLLGLLLLLASVWPVALLKRKLQLD
ncbi:MAG: energy-coupling factor transporter transmembrane component T [Dehalococcoidia bacterium]|nr:energy-coupling factor transporter transmembrane component T [Dehalococcoidia bacterium]